MHWANTSRCLGGCEAIRFYFLFLSPIFSDFSAIFFSTLEISIRWPGDIVLKKDFCKSKIFLAFSRKSLKSPLRVFPIPPSLLLKGVLWCVHSADVENTLQSHWGTIEREWRKRSMLWRVHKMSREFQEMFYTWCSSLFSSLFLFYFFKFYLFLTPPTFYSSLCGINPAVVMFPQGFDFTRIYDGKFKWGKIAFGESSNQCRNF